MWTTLIRVTRSNTARRFSGDGGFAIVLVALLLVFFMVVAAIVVDLANAREEDRQAVAAADAGALAGAQAINPNAVMPGACGAAGSPNDVNCLAAYHTFSSTNIIPTAAQMTARSTCTFDSVKDGETCWHYTSGKASVEVKRPYILPGTTSADNNLIHVKVCWDTATTFARVIGISSVNVCGTATAKNTPPGTGGTSGVTTDCSVEDNFVDPGNSGTIYVFDPGKYPDEGGQVNFAADGGKTPKAKEDLVVVFDGHDSEIDLSSVTFTAPTYTSGLSGTSVPLQRLNPTIDRHGPESPAASGASPTGSKYVIQSLANPVYGADGTLQKGTVKTYTPGAPWLTIISYQLPDDAHLGGAGSTFIFTAKVHATDSDNGGVDPPTKCGNASWTFNHNGSITSSGGSTCGENSFYGFPALPPDGKVNVKSNPIIQAFYTDESHLQYKDYTDPYWQSQAGNYGVDFTYTKTGDPTVHRITPSTKTGSSAWGLGLTIPVADDYNPATPSVSGGYWFQDPSVSPYIADKFYTTIKWDASALTDGTYTINLKMFDTDNNKAGNDCGVMTWTIAVSGNPGDVRLIE